MLVPRRRTLDMLSISALDLFASGLGAFMLLAVSFFPYYLRSPSLESEKEGARAELSAAAEALQQAERAAADALRQKTSADAALAAAQQRLAHAQQAASAATEALEQASVEPEPAIQPVAPKPTSTGRVRLAIADLDLMFAMDTTGSMRDEVQGVQANLLGVIRVLHRLTPTLRVGFVAYRDRGDSYITRAFPLSPMDDSHEAQILRFVQELSAKEGGDVPEKVDEALRVASSMPWRTEAQGRIVVIGDAPAHPEDVQTTFSLAERFRRSAPSGGGPRSVSTIFTGNAPDAAAFFQRLAQAGGGDFSVHQGRMIESVLMSVLNDPTRRIAGQ